jgi:hypothetical protein
MKTPLLVSLLLFWLGFVLICGVHNTLAVVMGGVLTGLLLFRLMPANRPRERHSLSTYVDMGHGKSLDF